LDENRHTQIEVFVTGVRTCSIKKIAAEKNTGFQKAKTLRKWRGCNYIKVDGLVLLLQKNEIKETIPN
jgi:hypothetical protein